MRNDESSHSSFSIHHSAFRMNLSALLPLLRALPEYDDLRRRAGRESVVLRLPRAARLPFVAALAADLNRPPLPPPPPHTHRFGPRSPHSHPAQTGLHRRYASVTCVSIRSIRETVGKLGRIGIHK